MHLFIFGIIQFTFSALTADDNKLVVIILSSTLPLILVAIFVVIAIKYRGLISKTISNFNKTKNCVDDDNSQPQVMELV